MSAIARGVSIGGAVAFLIAVGCGGGERSSELPEEIAPAPEPPLDESERPESIYGDDGELLESDARVAGLQLPRGLEVVIDEERRHVYRSEAPLQKVQSYFGVRLVTGEVDARPGGGATYVDALPRGVRGGEVRLDVTVEPSSAAPTRVEIIEREPEPATPPSEEESLRRLRERMERAD